MYDPHEHVLDLMADVAALRAEVKRLAAASKWRSVGNTLPESAGDYHVYVPGYGPAYAHYIPGRRYWVADGGERVIPTHWAPMPTAPHKGRQ